MNYITVKSKFGFRIMGKKISPSLEDYLEAIYFLQQVNKDVRVTDLAHRLNISKPSVNRAIKNLKKYGFVNHENYGFLNLTENGFVTAQNIAMRHITLKKFLSDLLGVEKNIAEIEACHLEHSMSDDTIKKLQNYLKKVGV